MVFFVIIFIFIFILFVCFLFFLILKGEGVESGPGSATGHKKGYDLGVQAELW